MDSTTTTTRPRAEKQEQLAIALGAAGAFLCLPDDQREASDWLTGMARSVGSWGYTRMPEAQFVRAFYDALERSGFVDHLRACLADREAEASEHFEVTAGDLDELLTALGPDVEPAG